MTPASKTSILTFSSLTTTTPTTTTTTTTLRPTTSSRPSTTKVRPTKTTTVGPTGVADCAKDIIVMVQDSTDTADSSIKMFLSRLVRSIPVGSQDSLLALSLFDSGVHVQWDFDDSQTQQSLVDDINGLVFRHRNNGYDTEDMTDLVSSYSHHHGGDRFGFPDAVVLIVDSAHASSAGGGDRKRAKQSRDTDVIAGNNVIVVNVGGPGGSLNNQATNWHHVIEVNSFANLPNEVAAVRDLLCNY